MRLQQKTGSGSFYRKTVLPKFFDRTPFDRNTIWPNTIWPKVIWPKSQLTESPFSWTTFNRKNILPKKVIWTEDYFIERSFHRKKMENGHLTENLIWKVSHLTERSFDRKVVWPKTFLISGHLSEKVHLDERSFAQKCFLTIFHLTNQHILIIKTFRHRHVKPILNTKFMWSKCLFTKQKCI
jgi:hypothetical protein